MSTKESLESQIIIAIRKIIRAVGIYSKRLREQYGLGASHLACLKTLLEQGPSSFQQIAKSLQLTPSMITALVDQLSQKDMVRRAPSAKDRRVIFVELTPLGEETANQAPPSLQQRLLKNLAELDNAEKQAIHAHLSKIITFMQAEELTAAPLLGSGDQLTGEPESMLTHNGTIKDGRQLP